MILKFVISKAIYHIEMMRLYLVNLMRTNTHPISDGKCVDYGYHVIDTDDTGDYLPYENIWGMIEKN